ncbi:MAG: TolC family protein [Planctomycetes bacterium]|nr:TolC family protein [Planctomycetota bacterium]
MRRFALLILLLAGCQSYEPQPLDEDAALATWRERKPGNAAQYAAELSKRSEKPRAPFNAQDGLGLEEAEAVALFFNPGLRVARLRAGVELAAAEESGRWEDPELSVEGGWIIDSIPNPWFLAASISFTIPLSGRPGVEQDLAFARYDVAKRQVVVQEWELLVSLRRQWRELELAREHLALTKGYLLELDALLEKAQRLQEAGEISSLDQRLVEMERAAARAERLSLEQAAAESESALKETLGLHPDAPLVLVSGAPTVTQAAAGAEKRLRANHTGLALHRSAYETAEQELRLEIRKQYPDLHIGPGYEIDEGQSRITLGLGIPIPIINLNREGIARARASRAAARAEFEAELEGALHALAQAQQKARHAEQLRAQFLREVVPLADQQVADANALADAGEFDALVQLEVLSRRHETRVKILEVLIAAAQAQDAVVALLGPAFKPQPDEQEKRE